jgi:nicotinamide mononucleotide transporter
VPVSDIMEILGVVSGIVNVWLLARQNIWNWPVGLANNGIYAAVFLTSGLYGDAGLQLVFIVLGIGGWWNWWRAKTPSESPAAVALRVRSTSRKTWLWLLPMTLLSALGLHWFLARFTNSTVPGWDGFTTALSLAATYLQIKKLLETWWFWILVDLIYIPLYISKDLWKTSVLYGVFLILCVMGLRQWQREWQSRSSRASGVY